jgi:hypothetical protein
VFAAATITIVARPAAVRAQEYVVAVAEENVRARPNGAKLGTVRRGASLAGLGEDGRWVKASLRAWIWKPSVSAAGSRLTVSAPRENLRASPSAKARLLGSVLRGARLDKIGERGRWYHVEHDGWIWEPSLAAGARAAGPAATRTPSSTDAAGSAVAPSAGRADRTVSVETENLRWAPDGRRIGRLHRGADLEVLGTRGRWLRVRTRGSFWSASAAGSGSARTVKPASENLRLAPGSEIVGVLDRGTALKVVGRAGRWLDVEVIGWMWAPSTRSLGAGAKASAAEEAAARGDGAKEPRGGSSAGDPGAGSVTEAAAAPEPAPAAPDGSRAMGGATGAAPAPPRTLALAAPLRDAPGGKLVGHTLAGGTVVPLRTQGDWVKVRLEGWMHADGLAGAARGEGPVTVGAVVADPASYRGAEVTWRLELISAARADSTRPDFREGEHYLLTRNAGGEHEHVYVVVSGAQAERLGKLPAFTVLTVRGVVREGRSRLVGNPILDLRELVGRPVAP